MRTATKKAIALALLAGSSLIPWNLAGRATGAAGSLQDRDSMKPLQHVAASQAAKFGTVDEGDGHVPDALNAKALPANGSFVGKEDAFKGTVSKRYEDQWRPGDLGLSSQLPDRVDGSIVKCRLSEVRGMKTLEGKETVVSGKFVDYRGNAKIALTEYRTDQAGEVA